MRLTNWLRQEKQQDERQEAKDTDTLPLSEEQTEQDICGDRPEMNQSNALEVQLSFVQSIKELPLKHFIDCCCHHAYGLLITSGHKELTEIQAKELYNGWLALLSQYYDACGDEALSHQLKLTLEMRLIEAQRYAFETIIAVLRHTYCPEVANTLADKYGRSFSPETLEDDIAYVEKLGKKELMRYDQLKYELERMVKQQGGDDKKLSAAAQEESFYNTLFDINAAEKGAYTKDISTYEFALLRKRLIKHIEHLQSQSKK